MISNLLKSLAVLGPSLGILMLLSACLAPASQASSPAVLTVAAAADLQFAFQEIGDLFEQETDQEVTFVFGSSGQLAQQIEDGAPFDLFASANISFVTSLAQKKLVLPESVQLYARGRIVLAVNRLSGIEATTLPDLLSPQIKHIAITNPAHAPYGAAAKEALIAAGVWEAIQPRIVYGENVRQTLQYIQNGDAEAGIISLSVADVPEITWTLIDQALHAPLDQALAVVTSSSQQDLALEFASFVNGPLGRPIMQKHGFIFPDEIVTAPVP